MSEKFSPALRLTDLNDFIAPSQDCVVSLKATKPAKQEKNENREKVQSFGQLPQAEPVRISLKDCLACSGCITSAETIMLEKQSLDEFLAHTKSDKTVIVSISPQSRTSLAAFFDLSPSQVFRKLTTLFKSLGVKAVYDTSCSRDLSLIESCNEFISRYQKTIGGKETGSVIPMLSSACPGWICYAEKTLGAYILPYISSVKSPQQTIGAAIKHHIVKKMGLKPDNVYHVTVMPCYDKKLEAARDDFVFSVQENGNDESGMKMAEVDSVLTSGEVLDLIQFKAIDFKTLEETPLDNVYFLAIIMDIELEQGEGFGVLLKQGAEARIFESTFIGRRSIVKERFSKKYRHPILDSKLTLKRLNAEARCMTKARRLGVPTPVLYAVDPLLHTLTFEYVDGPSVKDVLLDFGLNGIIEERLQDICAQIGNAIAKLHDGGLVHGDLTTSNMIVKKDSNQLVLIDFGLSFTSTIPEDKAVDLYVLERALLSMHSSCGNVMELILAAYRKSSRQWSATMNKLTQVRLRGRKRTMIG